MSTEYINEQGRISYVDVPAILGGTVLALAISIILSKFGSAIGLAISIDHNWTGDTALAGVIATGIWILWIQFLASLTGGYLSGRMRRPVSGSAVHEREIRDGAHGLMVWALSTVAVAIGASLVTAVAAFVPSSNPEEAAALLTQTPEMVDMTRNTAIIFAFATAAISLVSAVVSWWAATLGGEHRDNAVDHSGYVSFRKR
ncbi:MAG: hypothetical protein ACT4OY_02770 [Alphaproteobacteria bacterium]